MRPLYACCLVLCLVVSFFLGRFTSETPIAGSHGHAASSDKADSRPDSLTSTNSSTTGTAPGQDSASETAEQVLAQSISRCASESTGLSRFFAFSEALQKIDASNWRQAFQMSWKARTSAAITEAEHQLFLQRIGEVGGVDAMLRFRPQDPVNNWETHTGRYAMQGWAQRDPEAARAWLETQPAGKYRTGMLIGYLRSASLKDASAAFETLRQLAEGPDSEGRLVGSLIQSADGARYAPLFQAWTTKGGASSEIAPILFNQLVESQLRLDWNGKSEAIQRWFEPYLNQGYVSPQAATSVLRRMTSDQAPEALLPWVERLPAGSDVQKSGVQFLMDTWARNAPDTLAQWLSKERSSPHYDVGVQLYLTRQRGSLDQSAWQPWLDTIQNPQIRETTRSAMTAPIIRR